MNNTDGTIPTLLILGSLVAAHEVIRRDHRLGSLYRKIIPMLVSGYHSDTPQSILATTIYYMGSGGWDKPFNNDYGHMAFRPGLNINDPVDLLNIHNSMRAHYPVFSVDLIPKKIVLHDDSASRLHGHQEHRLIYSGNNRFWRVLDSIGPNDVVVQVLFDRGVDGTIENLDHAQFRSIWSDPFPQAVNFDRAYGWLICGASNPKKTGVTPGE